MIRGVFLLQLHVKTFWMPPVHHIVLCSLAGIEVHGIEVGYGDGPSMRGERTARDTREVSIEGLRFRMRENDMSMH